MNRYVDVSFERESHSAEEVCSVQISGHEIYIDIEMVGEILFLVEECEIERLRSGARLKIEEGLGRRRRLVVEPGPQGEPEYAWSLGGETAPFDEDAREWLRGIVLEILHATGIAGDRRVRFLLDQGGVEKVLEEIGEIPEDSMRVVYYQHLLAQTASQEEAPERILGHAGERIDSDFDLRQVLSFALRRCPDPPACDAALKVARGIGTDFELAELLIEAAGLYPRDQPLPVSFSEALQTLDSGFEHRRVLSAAFRRPGLDADNADRWLVTARNIRASHELAELLVDVASTYPQDRTLPPSFFQTARTIRADFELCRVLKSVLHRSRLSREDVLALLATSHNVGSEHELAQFLCELAWARLVDSGVRREFDQACSRVGSGFEREKLKAALETAGR